MEDDVAAVVSKITVYAGFHIFNMSYFRLLIMVPECARPAVSDISLNFIVVLS
jgi:hypothetical protein